jgi:hypothetical protein
MHTVDGNGENNEVDVLQKGELSHDFGERRERME